MDFSKDANILICDDSITNTLILKELIENELDANVICVTDPRNVQPELAEHTIDLVLLDIEMPYLNGFEVMDIIRQSTEVDELPILIITGNEGIDVRNKALASGANDFLNKPIDQIEVILRARNLLKIRKSYLLHKETNTVLEHQIEQRTDELNQSIKALLQSLAAAGELKDNETGKHVLRVGQFARILAQGYGLSKDLIHMIELTAPLHDIGKIGIPDSILLKPASLTEHEREIIKRHTIYAQDMINHDSPLIQMAKSIAVSHHENWDGSGYPNGLAGQSIPIEGRITALADVYDALTTKRPYKEPWPDQEVLHYIKDQSGKQFEPLLVEIFLANIEQFNAIKEELSDH
ncbi:two-component system response regulator [Thalassotalea insulae]|uniref:Two-component system response regulator n=1 Tax=Thalassotalea insulae TaxID=2056778 RepID=A0ABQ6GP61_9GAMM|nr:HD domain-containing phosphohydrolase [Thalassotalea insulae]GLX77104.1 two-component system response regulator [Thalassotalea insulae]